MKKQRPSKSEIFPSEKTLNNAILRLSSNILKLDQQFIYFNAEEIFYAFEVEWEGKEDWKSERESEK